MTNFEKVKEKWAEKDLLPDINGFEASFSAQICRIIKKMREKSCCGGANACKECYKWLQQEYKEPILDDAEREYLSAVIKPFRYKVEWIMKYKPGYTIENEEYIGFSLPNQVIDLPYFTAGTMYKGMTAGKKYTLEELGL